jgi:polar amino acid transport system substrate-binding protein
MSQAIDRAEVLRELAPSGKLRAAINLGNPILAQKGPAGGDPVGVSVDLARELARRLEQPLELVIFHAAGKVFEALKSESWDVAFLARDPLRAREIEFTAPYVLIEGGYVVRSDSDITAIDQVDRPGVRIAVAMQSAYDLHLSRTLRHADIVRFDSGTSAFDAFARDAMDALAGIKTPLAQLAAADAGLRLLPGRFMVIEQAMAVPKGRAIAHRYVSAFLREMKAAGFVAASLERSGQNAAAAARRR